MVTEYILGLPVDVITLDSIMEELPERLAQDEKTIYMSINPQIALHAHNYPKIVQLAEEASHRIPDGIGIVKASQRQGGNITERVTGIDLMLSLLDYANEQQESIFLYGAKPEVSEKLVEVITTDYPNIHLAGVIDGYTDMSDAQICDKINEVKPTFVFVALGFPRQEQWLAANYKKCDAKVFQDVGGSFDVISGSVKRAPDFFVKTNLEWLYRSCSDPKRLYRIAEIPKFVYQANKWFKSNKNV
ncbi:WecB/TagA/CpsF family glycosyltransferase [Vagococcus coleopterorum]|uniref:WecB/TagA/CpsF family glycosyltransferase n=1 Tax=Vagococcus coleopterorum TaxID=2714946 RepID=A0A6G8APW5_9ENTE|nr:WecB/TagA/CpsF family glycosyltransferase [Vagococcus coleopterorum]QIL46963.1 WecB/TagA/CpsF family glycosyltransferase [Vagococcus coleopterorum]